MSFNITKGPEGISISVNGDKITDVFKELAKLEEIFGISKCGKCGNTDLSFVVRNVDDNDYYEMRCKSNKCAARLAFGQHKKGGGIFPKRKDKDDKWLPDGGWMKWDKNQNKEI